MKRAIKHAVVGGWPTAKEADQVILDYDDRHRRRIRLRTSFGEEILLDLKTAIAMADGDGLQLNDSRWLRVTAKPENLVQITAENAKHLTRIAWHLGNRHLPAAISKGRILIRPDHVIEDMLLKLHATTETVTEPFQPEFGAYHKHNIDKKIGSEL